jgi:hypothetical protein
MKTVNIVVGNLRKSLEQQAFNVRCLVSSFKPNIGSGNLVENWCTLYKFNAMLT